MKIYRDINTGRMIHSEEEKNDSNLVLVAEIRNGKMKKGEIRTK